MIRLTVLALAAASVLGAPGADARTQVARRPAARVSTPSAEDAAPRELLPADRAELERRVRSRCGVGAETPDSFLPWYYHYVLGMEYHRAGDETRALDCIKSAVARRPEPKTGARIYGMWFVDYLPYSTLADINEHLGYTDCAADARRLAEALEPPRKK